MDGVTILSTENVDAIVVAISSGMLALMFLLLVIFIFIKFHDDPMPCYFIVVLSFFLCIILAWFSVECVKLGSWKQHKATIDETVSFTDFSEKYTVIKQDGLIYTITERKQND